MGSSRAIFVFCSLVVLFVSLILRFGTICQLMYNLVHQFMFLKVDPKLVNCASICVIRRDLIERSPLHGFFLGYVVCSFIETKLISYNVSM